MTENAIPLWRSCETAVAYDSLVSDIAIPVERTAEPIGSLALPDNLIVVSADTHWSMVEDIFVDRFPVHLKDHAPRLVTEASGVCQWYVDGSPLLPEAIVKNMATFESMPGSSYIAPRLHDMAAEGVEHEIAFGNAIGLFLTYPDLEVREWVFRIYNQHLAEQAALSNGRFHGVGMINFWDMDRVADSIAELKALGLKTYLLPQAPRGADNTPLNYCMPEMEPLWRAAEEAKLPICFHVGEYFQDGPGGIGVTSMVNFGPFRKTLGELIFGGIFDRHPNLKVVFVEAEINWVPGALQTATMVYECFRSRIDPMIAHHPRHYWHNNCYAVFTHDPAGLRLLDLVGADRVMWSSDYPHPESTWGYSRSSMQCVLEATTPEQARLILGETARSVFGIN